MNDIKEYLRLLAFLPVLIVMLLVGFLCYITTGDERSEDFE